MSARKVSVRPKIPKALRVAVWNRYHQDREYALCFVGCQTKITPFDFECGHVVAFANGGPTQLDNLRPICSTCNKSMGRTDMDVFIKTYGFHSMLKNEPTISGAIKELASAFVHKVIETKHPRYTINMYRNLDKLTKVANKYHQVTTSKDPKTSKTLILGCFLKDICHLDAQIKTRLVDWNTPRSGETLMNRILEVVNDQDEHSTLDVTMVDRLDLLLIKYLKRMCNR
jgi:hypothetical protein